jgi:NAD(P)-dependent dehydrogenase (short-subunit alcohol dehydrogenase family)
MKKQGWGRIVNVSSGMGSVARGFGGDSPAYRISKLALNGLTIAMAEALNGSGVLVNSVDPGWVRTEMGGKSATRSVQQGAHSVVWAALLPDNGPSGGFFYDGKPVQW